MSLIPSLMRDFDSFFPEFDMQPPLLMNSNPFALLERMGPTPSLFGMPSPLSRNPFGFPDIGSVMKTISNDPNAHVFTSSTICSARVGENGAPEIYTASSSTRQAPGGIKETRKSVADSKSGRKKMQIGHHIGERGHVLSMEHNVRTGHRSQDQELINMDDDDVPNFNSEWDQRTKKFPSRSVDGHKRLHGQRTPKLALTYEPSSRDYRSRHGIGKEVGVKFKPSKQRRREHHETHM